KNVLEDIVNELLEKLKVKDIKDIADTVLTELEGKTLEEYLKGKLEDLGITNIDDIASLLTQTIIARLEAFLKGTDVNDSVDEELQELVNDTISKISEGIDDAKEVVEV